MSSIKTANHPWEQRPSIICQHNLHVVYAGPANPKLCAMEADPGLPEPALDELDRLDRSQFTDEVPKCGEAVDGIVHHLGGAGRVGKKVTWKAGLVETFVGDSIDV